MRGWKKQSNAKSAISRARIRARPAPKFSPLGNAFSCSLMFVRQCVPYPLKFLGPPVKTALNRY